MLCVIISMLTIINVCTHASQMTKTTLMFFIGIWVLISPIGILINPSKLMNYIKVVPI
jgi:hypothetical protein